MDIVKLLKEWLEFSKDVQPGCAAGADQLDFLRSTTEVELKKMNSTSAVEECKCIRLTGGDKWYANGCALHPYIVLK